ncbi:MAG: phage tail assembly chaperone [Sphingobium sp.]
MTFTQCAVRLSGVTAWALGWTPDLFWRATPDELAAVFGAASGDAGVGAPPDAGTLARLREMYPDG